MKRLVICLLLALCTVPAFAQLAPASYAEVGRPLLRHFGAQAYGAAAQNWAIVQDEQGRMYFGNDRGLLVYDGVTWKLIPTPGNAVLRSLAYDEAGTLYAGTFGDFGYFQPDRQGVLRFTSLQTHIPEQARDFVDVWKTHATPEGIYFQTESYLFRWNGEAINVWHPAREFGFSWTSFYVRGRLYVQDFERGLLTLQDDSLHVVLAAETLAERRITVMLPYREDQMLIGTDQDGLFIYDGVTLVPFSPATSAYVRTNRLFSGIVLPDGTYGFNTLGGGFVRCDAQGNLLQRIDKSVGLKDQSINAAYMDRQYGLWLASSNGLDRVEIDTPLGFLDDASGLAGNVLAIQRHAGRLYVGTMLGLFVLRPVQTPLASPIFESVDALRNVSVWALLEAQGTLLAATDHGVYQIAGSRADRVDEGWALSLLAAQADDRLLFVGLANGLLRLRYQPARDTWESAGRIEGVTTSLFNLAEAEPQTLWLGTDTEGVIRLAFDRGYQEEPVVTHFGVADGLPEGQVLATRAGGTLRFQTEEGLFRYDPAQTLPFFPDTTLGTSRRIYGLSVEDQAGAIWAKHDEGLGLLQPTPEGSYTWVQAGLTRRFSAWDLEPFYIDEANGVVWFGGTEQVVRYDPNEEHASTQADPVLLGHVTVGDSLLFGGIRSADLEIPVMSYGSSTLRFAYALPTYDTPELTQYQVFLEGFDKDWSAWTHETQKDYTNLPGGSYRFHVRAQNVYGQESETEAFAFTVLPPWYRTGWAYLLYALFGLGLLYAGARAWNWRLEQRNRQLEVVIAERTEALRHTNAENERLLLNILPESIAERLKHSDEPIADAFPDVTVLFADLVGFTTIAQQVSAAELVALLNDLFSDFDALVQRYGVEKIKTIGDAYMAVCGLPEEREDHAEAMAMMALEMHKALEDFNASHGTALGMRVGLNTGPVVAGVIGTHKFIYDLWGDTVNTASRMESHGVPGHVQVSATTYERLKEQFVCEGRGVIEIKGKPSMQTYLLKGRKHESPATTSTTASVLSSEIPSSEIPS